MMDDFVLRKILWKTVKFPYKHKTAVNLREWYRECILELEPEKIHNPVTDNTSNVISAFRDMNGVGCTAHQINLVVSAMMSSDDALEMKLLNTSAKKLVTHVKSTNVQSTLPKKMKQSEPTRWNSSLTMFKSIAAVWNEISAIMVERNEVEYLSGITANKVSDVIQFLKPFKDASDELE